MTTLNQIADDYVERSAALDPILATYAGIAGHDDALPDLSTDGYNERAEYDRSTLAAVSALTPQTDAERVARLAMIERLGLAVETHDAGDDTSALNVLASADPRGAPGLRPHAHRGRGGAAQHRPPDGRGSAREPGSSGRPC